MVPLDMLGERACRHLCCSMPTLKMPATLSEAVQGETLRDLLERERLLPATQVVRTLLPILAGLTCAHARGIVHRDLKPDNIFLARDDAGCVEPKIVDFGIAKLEGATSHLTAVGVFVGSPSYMSPERALGYEEDMRADVWAIAVVLYEAISGRVPWEGPSRPALLRPSSTISRRRSWASVESIFSSGR